MAWTCAARRLLPLTAGEADHVFTRVADRKHSSGFYVNFIFEIDPGAVNHLRQRFDLNDEVFRVLFTVAPPPKEATQSK